MEDKTTALVTPWTHNKGLHEAVVALKKIAESPGELQAYQQMPETGKQILLQRKQDAHKGAATERIEQASTCKSLEATYLPLVERALLPFQVRQNPTSFLAILQLYTLLFLPDCESDKGLLPRMIRRL